MSFYMPYYGYDPQGGFGGLDNLLQQPSNPTPSPTLSQPAQNTTPTQASPQPTQQTQLSNPMLGSSLGEQPSQFDFSNVNWLSPAGSLLSPALSIGGNLIGGNDVGFSGLAGAGLGALTNVLGQAGKTPVFSEMGQQAMPVLSSVLGGGATSLINSINPVGTMLGMGGTGGNLGGTIGGAATPAIAGGLNAVGLAPGIADALGLGTTAAVEGGAFGGAGIGAGLGALGGAGLALSFPAMALGNFLYGFINELGGGDHPSMAEYQQSAALGQIQAKSSDLLGKLKGAGMTDSQIIDWANKNNINYMLGPMAADPSQMYSGGGGTQTLSYGGQPDYLGGTKEGIVALATPAERQYLDFAATGAMYGQPTSWSTFEGSPYGWNAPKNYLYYSPEGASNLEGQFGLTWLSQGTQPPTDYTLPSGVQAVVDASWKDYTGAQAPTDLEKDWVTNEIAKQVYNNPQTSYSQEAINLGAIPTGWTPENQGVTPNAVHELYNHLLQNYSDPTLRDWMAGRDVLWGTEAGVGSQLGVTGGGGSPVVQSYYAPMIKQYTDMGYDQATAEYLAGGGIDYMSTAMGSYFGPQDPFLSAVQYSGEDPSTLASYYANTGAAKNYLPGDPAWTPQGYALSDLLGQQRAQQTIGQMGGG